MEIEDILKKITINNKDQFSTSITIPSKNFLLNFKNIGQIKFPLSPLHLKKILGQGNPAPFGWKDKTIYDKSVRDCTEIEPDHFIIDPKWNESLTDILIKTKKTLGLEDGTLEAHLYKMLIYEKDQFFKPHQDSEKLEGMIATLVVVLPSLHRGGDISITHNHKKINYKTDHKSQDIIQAIAFYADCHHEVAPIKDGSRVVLTYNLVFKRKISEFPKADKKIENWLENYFSPNGQLAEKFVFLFDHQYTQKSLGFHSLKGHDFLRAQTLISACQSLDYICAFALADLHEVWSCEGSYDSYNDYSRGRRYDYDSEYDDDDNSDDENYSLEELVDQDVELKHLKFLPQGLGGGMDDARKAKMKDLIIHSNELFMAIETKDFTPFSSEFEGWMGNYGNTLDRWYHRAGIIIWPRNYSSVFILKNTPHLYLKAMRKKLEKASQQGILDENIIHEQKNELTEIMREEKYKDYQFKNFLSETNTYIDLLTVLNFINDQDLTKKYLNFTSEKILIEEEWEVLCDSAELNGKKWCEEFLRPWIFNNKRQLNFKGLSFCCQYVSTIKESSFLTAFFFSIFNKFLKQQIDYANQFLLLTTKKSVLKENEETIPLNIFLAFECLISLKLGLSSESQVLILKMQKVLYDFSFSEKSFVSPYLQYLIFLKINDSNMAQYLPEINFERTKKSILEKLNSKLSATTRSENDWGLKASIDCQCADCKTLVTFLNNKNLNKIALPLGKERRRHLHNQIQRSELDLSHDTYRVGSPFTLNIIKLPKIFKNSNEEADNIQKAILNLKKIKEKKK